MPIILAARVSSVNTPASSYVQAGMFVVTVPLSAGRVAFITVANVAARPRARHAPSHVSGYVLIRRVQSLVDR